MQDNSSNEEVPEIGKEVHISDLLYAHCGWTMMHTAHSSEGLDGVVYICTGWLPCQI